MELARGRGLMVRWRSNNRTVGRVIAWRAQIYYTITVMRSVPCS